MKVASGSPREMQSYQIKSVRAKNLPSDQNPDWKTKTLAIVQQTICENSSGLLREMGLEAFTNPGKMIRSHIVFRLGQILGAHQNLLSAWAATIEILHNATIVHDDLQDGDLFRRGYPAIWRKYGVAQAINLGDLFILISSQPIFSMCASAEIKIQLAQQLSVYSAKLVNGQSFEPTLNELLRNQDVVGGYFRCISQKTSALFALLAKGTATLAVLSAAHVDAIAELFTLLGNTFQVQDDILDLYGQKQRDEVGCDIREGKVSILVALHLRNHPVDYERVKSILKKPRELTTTQDVEAMTRLFVEKGTLQATLCHLDQMISEVQSHQSLRNNVGLAILVDELIQKILSPIAIAREMVIV